MLLVADKGREQEVIRVFEKWGLDAVIIGTVAAEPRLRITNHGTLVADIPNRSLTDDAPVYPRPVGTLTAPVQKTAPQDWDFTHPRNALEDLRRLLAAANICDKRWVYEQYDSMVQTNTVRGPGAEAGVMRVKSGSRFEVQGSREKT